MLIGEGDRLYGNREDGKDNQESRNLDSISDYNKYTRDKKIAGEGDDVYSTDRNKFDYPK